MTPDFDISPATLARLPQIHEFMLELPETSPYVLTSRSDERPSMAAREAWLQKICLQAGGLVLECRSGGKTVGLLALERSSKAKLRHHGTLAISVAARWRGQGVGRELMVKLLDWAQNQTGLFIIEAAAMEPNTPCLGLLEKFGFNRVAVRPEAFVLETGELINEVCLQLRLHGSACVSSLI